MEVEAIFTKVLYTKFEKCQKYMIPKEIYHKTIEDLKTLNQNVVLKSRHDYYILNKYEVLQCSEVEKLIKK